MIDISASFRELDRTGLDWMEAEGERGGERDTVMKLLYDYDSAW